MLLFGTEEHVDRWCADRSVTKGAVVPIEQVWRLAGPWYADRFDEDWRPKTPATIERLLSDAGLSGEFWKI